MIHPWLLTLNIMNWLQQQRNKLLVIKNVTGINKV